MSEPTYEDTVQLAYVLFGFDDDPVPEAYSEEWSTLWRWLRKRHIVRSQWDRLNALITAVALHDANVDVMERVRQEASALWLTSLCYDGQP